MKLTEVDSRNKINFLVRGVRLFFKRCQIYQAYSRKLRVSFRCIFPFNDDSTIHKIVNQFLQKMYKIFISNPIRQYRINLIRIEVQNIYLVLMSYHKLDTVIRDDNVGVFISPLPPYNPTSSPMKLLLLIQIMTHSSA